MLTIFCARFALAQDNPAPPAEATDANPGANSAGPSSGAVTEKASPALHPPSKDEDEFEFHGRLATNFQMRGRAYWPGPGSSGAREDFLAPLHQSVSARAMRVDSPLGEDSLEVQFAAYGQVGLGENQYLDNAYWDIASAYVEQEVGPAAVALGRQVMAGGAARYSRFDGLTLKGDLPFGLHLAVYGGLTALPRYNQNYGYHYLGSAYEDWSTEANAELNVPRGEYGLVGTKADWRDDEIGSLGVSYHYQAEDKSVTRATLGVNGSVLVVEGFDFAADALFSTDSSRFSEGRVSAIWEGKKWDEFGLRGRAEFMHVVPSLLLSQASVLSVFAFEQITEVGGEVEVAFPYRISLEASAYGQMYQEGQAGFRGELGSRFELDDEGTLLARIVAGRFDSETNGYWLGRASLSYRFLPHLRALGDLYQYMYDEEINGVSASTFYAMHVMYEPTARLNARLGGSISRSPYATVDAQMMARVEYHFDRSSRF